MARELTECQLIERSITKKYRKTIWNPFIEACKKYKLIEDGDKIACCISGGKDSWLTAKLLELLKRYTEIPFELEFIVMNPGYNNENLEKILENGKKLNVPIHVFETDIFNVAFETEKNPCYLCARMRRGHLYSQAKALGCNKIALGHHFSDVIETTLLGMFYGSQLQAMPPKLRSKNFEGMELIRPMYCIHEEDIISWKNYNNLEFIQCACRFTENRDHSGDGIGESKRQEIKFLIKELKKNNPNIENSIFSSVHSVWLDTFVGAKTHNVEYDFNALYEGRIEGFEPKLKP